VLKRLLAALAVVTLLTGFVAACGGDDDNKDDGGAIAADASGDAGGADAADDTAADDSGGDAKATFCADFGDRSGGDTPVDQVQESITKLNAAAAEAPEDVASAIGIFANIAQQAIDESDGETVTEDAVVEIANNTEGAQDADDTITQWCNEGDG
jgi:hypothetical protein